MLLWGLPGTGHSASIWQPFFSLTFSPCKTQGRHTAQQKQFVSLLMKITIVLALCRNWNATQVQNVYAEFGSGYTHMHICMQRGVLCYIYHTNMYGHVILYCILYTSYVRYESCGNTLSLIAHDIKHRKCSQCLTQLGHSIKFSHFEG